MTNKNKPTVTDEMVEAAALDMWNGDTFEGYQNAMRSALEAALAVQPKPQLTEEMCDVLGEHVYDNYGPSDRDTMRTALEAVFSIVGKK